MSLKSKAIFSFLYQFEPILPSNKNQLQTCSLFRPNEFLNFQSDLKNPDVVAKSKFFVVIAFAARPRKRRSHNRPMANEKQEIKQHRNCFGSESKFFSEALSLVLHEQLETMVWRSS